MDVCLDASHLVLLVPPGASQPENDTNIEQGVGCAELGTVHERTLLARALSDVLTGKPWSRRHLARVLGVDKRIVDWWCSNYRPINAERLLKAAPIVFVRWVERIEQLNGLRWAA